VTTGVVLIGGDGIEALLSATTGAS
jgi:hypothetical protein